MYECPGPPDLVSSRKGGVTPCTPENLVFRARDAGPDPRWSRGSLHQAETGASGARPSGEGATHGAVLLAPLRVQEGLEGVPLTQSPRTAQGPEELQTFGDPRGTQALVWGHCMP